MNLWMMRSSRGVDRGVSFFIHGMASHQSMVLGFLHSHSKRKTYGMDDNKPSSTIYQKIYLQSTFFDFRKMGFSSIGWREISLYIPIVHVWGPPSTMDSIPRMCPASFVPSSWRRSCSEESDGWFFWVCFRVILYFYQDELQKLGVYLLEIYRFLDMLLCFAVV